MSVHRIFVHFSLSHRRRPVSEVTSALGVEPSFVWRRGDRIGPTSRRYPENGWRFSSSADRRAPLSEHLSETESFFRRHAGKLRELGPAWDPHADIIVYGYGCYMPVLELGRSFLAASDEAGASIMFDLYRVAADDDDDDHELIEGWDLAVSGTLLSADREAGANLEYREGANSAGRPIRCGLPSSASLEEQLAAVLARLEVAASRLREEGETVVSQISVDVSCYGDFPLLSLEKPFVKRLASLGAELVLTVSCKDCS